MSSTSSEENPPHTYNPGPAGSETEDEVENGHEDGNERKRPRMTDSSRQEHMDTGSYGDRYGSSRLRDLEFGRSRGRVDGRSKPRSTSSRDPSPAIRDVPVPRTGKRLRRAPQRWDGERRDLRFIRGGPGSSKAREADSLSVTDGEQTLSANSFQQEQGPPPIADPLKDLEVGLRNCIATLNRRTIVDSFHSWQLKAVSKQAAEQKALHIYLKRKLRKRTTRAPEVDRLEEDALRNARNATFKRSAGRPGDPGEHYPTTVEDDASQLVPSKMRLPLEAYLPRRVKASRAAKTPEQVLDALPQQPHPPGASAEEVTDDTNNWPALPTVTEISSLNKPKSARYPVHRPMKATRPAAAVDPGRTGDD